MMNTGSEGHQTPERVYFVFQALNMLPALTAKEHLEPPMRRTGQQVTVPEVGAGEPGELDSTPVRAGDPGHALPPTTERRWT
ncbi:hypothetical protein GCM10023334_115120 [Nonomuraea thailandensis]